ncbi:MAG TPA: GDSL-type esterase/lipase family protein [Gemmataceae bacterium]|nr:GDSL-type esterase/lipase family protein [Gemmataceae bacterium]
MRRSFLLVVVGVFVAAALAQPPKEYDRAAKWEKSVAAIEKQQAESPPEKGGIVFAGSSTVRLWDVGKAFPDWKVTNSGFGGSEIRDVTHFADRVILKHEPRAIVFYAGDNDINSGRTPDQVLADFRAFTDAAHKSVPRGKVYFISIKPSLARWKQFEAQTKANSLVKDFCARDDRLGYIDMVSAMLGKDGKPVPELFVKDGLHLSPKGYEIFNDAVHKAVN